MDPSALLAAFMDEKELAILQFFLQHDQEQYYLREISRKALVSPASTYRILNKLVALQVLDIEEIKTAKLYKLSDSKESQFLKSIIEVDVLEMFVQEAKQLEGVEQILQLGAKSKTRAKVMIIGESINKQQLKIAADRIKDDQGFSITYMTVSSEQYEQMSSMGLYPGSKKVLFSKKN